MISRQIPATCATGSEKAFTLIEMSIVLVIVGLIVGGILVGQEVIRAAKVRATITQIEKYNTAVNTFRTKYGELPGDLDASAATQFGFAPRGSYAGEGDNNGIIEGISANAPASNGGVLQAAGETAMFWVDISQVGLIEGQFNTASSTVPTGADTFTTTPAIPAFFPEAKMGMGNYVYVMSNNTTNYFGIEGIYFLNELGSGGIYGNQNIPPIIASAIDSKIDDGFPTTGRVTAQFVNGTVLIYTDSTGNTARYGKATNCFDNRHVALDAGGTMQYSPEVSNGTNPTCALAIQFQ